jgi:non-heme chloroperoxidase
MGPTHQITGPKGIGLSAYECGNPNGQAILLIHGLIQSCLSWKYQFDSSLSDEFRIVAMDMRGHGMSEKPMSPEAYNDGHLYAGDIAAVIDQLDLKNPVLSGWSYGGTIICDYLEHHGDAAIGAINFDGAAATLGTVVAKSLIGPGTMDLIDDLLCEDLARNIAATRQFIINCCAAPPSAEDIEEALAYNMMVPPKVRLWMFLREMHYGEVLKKVSVPTLVTQGTADNIVLKPMADIFLNAVPGAQASFYEGIGHAPHLEDPERFNRELAELARGVA